MAKAAERYAHRHAEAGMIHFKTKNYPYLEEVNEGILCQFQRLLPRTGAALDVGCGRGQLGEAIRQLGWEVWGIEQSPEACPVARGRLDRLIEADLNQHERIARELEGKTFDGLIFSDVLEHVYDPLEVLTDYLRYVKPGGRVFLSVPNTLVWTNRLMLLFGRFEYADTGAMDRTHIRFFTFKTARELVRAAGCQLERVASTPHLVRALLPLVKRFTARPHPDRPPNPRALIESRCYQRYMKYVYPVEHFVTSLWRTLFAFRIIVVGIKLTPGRT
jgi:2-polyprenyl-3-methyl-5-hydroxy-6-metoxy-1,4-benzoquinol methylase